MSKEFSLWLMVWQWITKEALIACCLLSGFAVFFLQNNNLSENDLGSTQWQSSRKHVHVINKLQAWWTFLVGQIVALCWAAWRGRRFLMSLWWSNMSHAASKSDLGVSHTIVIITADFEISNHQISNNSGSSWAAMPLHLTLISWGQALQALLAIACQLGTEKEEGTFYTSTLKKVKHVFFSFSGVYALIKSCNILPIPFFSFFFLFQ